MQIADVFRLQTSLCGSSWLATGGFTKALLHNLIFYIIVETGFAACKKNAGWEIARRSLVGKIFA